MNHRAELADESEHQPPNAKRRFSLAYAIEHGDDRLDATAVSDCVYGQLDSRLSAGTASRLESSSYTQKELALETGVHTSACEIAA